MSEKVDVPGVSANGDSLMETTANAARARGATWPRVGAGRAAPLRVAAVLLAAVALLPAPARAQRAASAPKDSVSARCMDVRWLDPDAVCEGRLLNAAFLSMMGATVGASTGYLGGLVAPTQCIGSGDPTALRGAIAGAALGLTKGIVTRHISRRALAANAARADSAYRPVKPWSWGDVRPVVQAIGVVAAGGALVGVAQGARSPSPCAGGVGGGAAHGAAVYGAGATTVVVGGVLALHILF